MKTNLRAALAALLCAGLLTCGASAAVSFSDVTSTYWGRTYIERAAQEGLVSGMGDGTYGINDTLSSAQFVTMICNLFYKDEINSFTGSYNPADWWHPFMTVAYSKGLLANTTVGLARQSRSNWTGVSSVNDPITRYDMAQVMSNVLSAQSWIAPTAIELIEAQAKIGDWGQIPAQYRSAVATAYAKSFLSGMDSAGTFQGADSMTRTHGAVVLCKLSDAKEEAAISIPTFTNTTNLVNGSRPNVDNVEAALAELKKEYPSSYVWDVSQNYRSPALGDSSWSTAFIYKMSDLIFGNLDRTTTAAKNIKPGDIIHFSSPDSYAIVVERDVNDIVYLDCSSIGKVTWTNKGTVSGLSTRDVIYTRYEDANYNPLKSSSTVTEEDVEDDLDTFKRREYKEGSTWDMKEEYRSRPFVNKYVTGSQAFAYYLSDYLFDDAEVTTLPYRDFDDVRVGDVLHFNSTDAYGVVVDVYTRANRSAELTYVSVNNSGRVSWTYTTYVDDLTSKDAIYTRYDGASGSKTNTLSNGKAITERNVSSLIEDFRDDAKKGYDDGDTWDQSSYTSTEFYRRAVTDADRAFSYYLSDYIFGSGAEVTELTYSHFDEVRVGDVIYLDDDATYGVVTKVSGGTIYYVSVNNNNKVRWDRDSYSVAMKDLTKNDAIYSRY